MLQFTVPQFIDVEDKIIGPVTTRQFIIMLTGSIFIVLAYKLFDFTMFLAAGISILAVSGVIAFLKINGMPFHFFLLNFLQTMARPGLRVWYKVVERETADTDKETVISGGRLTAVPAKPFPASRLTELALIVDTKGAYQGNDSSYFHLPENSEMGGANKDNKPQPSAGDLK
jgi:hypothetical protein